MNPIVYGIRETRPDGTGYMVNTMYRSRAKAEAEADKLRDAFPEYDYTIKNFWLW